MLHAGSRVVCQLFAFSVACNVLCWNAAKIHTRYLTDERRAQLEELGMIWTKLDHLWERSYSAAEAFFRVHGHLKIPVNYITETGLKLGGWIQRQRRLYAGKEDGHTLTPEQIQRLDSIGMEWSSRYASRWTHGFYAAAAYAARHGTLDVPATFHTEDGFALGAWLNRQRDTYHAGKLSPERAEQLESLGIVWEKENPWMLRYELVRAYCTAHGHVDIPQTTVVEGIWLGKWLDQQKKLYFSPSGQQKLSEQQRALLSRLPIKQAGLLEQKWEAQYEKAADFYEIHGHLRVPDGYIGADGKRLDAWVSVQRSKLRQGKLPPAQVQKLSRIGLSK